jgi:phosphomannomutase
MHELFWKQYFVSGEINVAVENVPAIIEQIKSKFISEATKIDEQDGISLDFADQQNEAANWRFSVRGSNTEPVIRLNVEAASQILMEEKRDQLLAMLK